MKKQKIVITGALGYIGYELCKLYSGETRYKEIYATDIKFLSDQVKQLTDWGFKFVQLNILDNVKIKELCHDADIVHHLAGITDVSYTKSESSELKDKSIADTAIVGTSNILNVLPDTSKLIFPSTHVIYDEVFLQPC